MTFNFQANAPVPVAQPSFPLPPAVAAQPGFTAVQQPAQAGFPQQPIQAGYAADPLDRLASAEVWETGKPKLPVWQDAYVVRIDKVLAKNDNGGAYIAEYTVVESSNPAVPAGTQSSHYQGLGKFGLNYLANWLCDILGIERADKAKAQAALQALPAIMRAAITGVKQQSPQGEMPPSVLIGRLARITVCPPRPTAKPDSKGILHNQEYWSAVK